MRKLMAILPLLVLASCSTTTGPSSFGSPERISAAITCFQYALPAASADAITIETAKGTQTGVTTAGVLDALSAKVAKGEATAAAAACAPYLGYLVTDGNAQAAALKAKMDAKK